MSLFLHFVVHESSSTLSTVVTILVLCHEAPNTSYWTVLPQPNDLSISFHSVILESLEWDGLAPPLGLLWLGVNLLLALLTTSTETKDQVQGRLLLDVIVGESAAVLELLSGEDEALLVRWDAFLVLDLSLD